MAEPARRRTGIRLRITAVAGLAVALALVVGAVLFWLILRESLLDQMTSATRQDAAAFAEQVDETGIESLPDLDDDRLWQVIDRDRGTVIDASDVAEDLPALADRDAGVAGLVDIAGEGVYVLAADRDGDAVVVAGRATAEVDATLAAVAALLAVAVPVVVMIVGVTVWLVVGRSLAPVERLRREVDAVGDGDLSRRVHDPGTRDEIGRLAHTMNDMLARLEIAQQTQRRFISDASHELKSPLAVLRQYAEVARDHPAKVSPGLLTETVLSEGERLERLVQGMLVLARADERALVLTPADVDLDDVLLAEAQRLRAHPALAVDTSGIAPVRVRADAGLLGQAVRNLVDNAARHARRRIALAVTAVDGTALLTVDDDGPGVPPGDRERVFERFVRLDEARSRDAGGSGLGLSIVREIAVRHGGSVRIAEAPGGGARAELRVPLAG
ncbi:sensor histidine kinase [Microbacterium hominis]|uniref:histidine kinase n=1 Tax=Microbacterium hominis TaxID=162426 RepID=A0A7D4TFK6_9MICO|nr:HAMP domain-containing sensor histidine kinase [Microbacterium hominis]QKJ18621.1 HAMP domain-containing histidine kinase [Microbacterium hominis]